MQKLYIGICTEIVDQVDSMPKGGDEKGDKEGEIAVHSSDKRLVDNIFEPYLEAAVPVLCLFLGIGF